MVRFEVKLCGITSGNRIQHFGDELHRNVSSNLCNVLAHAHPGCCITLNILDLNKPLLSDFGSPCFTPLLFFLSYLYPKLKSVPQPPLLVVFLTLKQRFKTVGDITVAMSVFFIQSVSPILVKNWIFIIKVMQAVQYSNTAS